MPRDGQSLLDLTRLPEGAGDQVQANITIDGDPPVATMARRARWRARDDAALHATSRSRGRVARRRPQAVAPFATPVSIPAGALDGLPRAYVNCSRTARSRRRCSGA